MTLAFVIAMTMLGFVCAGLSGLNEAEDVRSEYAGVSLSLAALSITCHICAVAIAWGAGG